MDDSNQGSSREDERDPLTYRIIGCAYTVYNKLGVGLLESAYETFLARELIKTGFAVVRQVALAIEYDGILLDAAYRPDLVVDGQVIIEVKTLTKILPVHRAQLLTYLRFSGIEKGLVLNFHALPFRDGILRVINSKKYP